MILPWTPGHAEVAVTGHKCAGSPIKSCAAWKAAPGFTVQAVPGGGTRK